MQRCFPSAKVSSYQDIVPGLMLPDEKDRHVLAAAVAGNSSIIVTANLRDFPPSTLRKYGVAAVHPDDFCVHLLITYPEVARDAFTRLVKSLRNPPMSHSDVLSSFERVGLRKTSKLLSAMLGIRSRDSK